MFRESATMARRRGVGVALCMLFCAAAAAATSSVQSQTPKTFALPAVGDPIQQAISRGEVHEWPLDLASGEFLHLTIDPSDIDVAVSVVAPDGGALVDNAGASLSLGIDGSPRLVVSLIAAQTGRHALRLAVRDGGAENGRYRLRVEGRHPSTAADTKRIAGHRLWLECMKAFEGSPDARRSAIAKYEEALRLFREIGDAESEALTLGSIAYVWYTLSDAKQGTAAAEQGLEIWKRLGREREEGIALSDLGVLAYLGYDHAAGRRFYEQALPKLRAANDARSEAATLTRMGWIHNAAGELAKSIDVNQQALQLWRDAGDVAGEAVSLNDLGRAYFDLGDVQPALDAYQKALALRPPDRQPRGAAQVLTRIGLLYLSLSEWQRALDAFQQALALARRVHDQRNEATILVNIGSTYQRVGDTTQALRYLEPALPLCRALTFRNCESNVLVNLGLVSNLRGDWTKSRDYFTQALDISVSIKDVRTQAIALRNLAAIEVSSGSPQQALTLITESIKKSPGAAGTAYAGLLTLANVQAALGDAQAARATYDRELARARETRDRAAEARALTYIGRFLAKEKNYAQARELLAQAIDINESLRNQLVDPELRMNFTTSALAAFKMQIGVLMELERESPGTGFAQEAFLTNERARARGLMDLLATSGVDVREGVDPALVQRERTLRWNLNAKAAVQTNLLTGKRDAARLKTVESEINELSAALRETTTRIRQESPAYASLTQPQPLTAAEIGRLLDGKTVLLEFALGETESWLYAIDGGRFESFQLPARQTIEDAARELYRVITARQPVKGETAAHRQQRITRSDAELADRSRTLGDMILGPARGKLASDWRGRRLAVVAGGALEYVPFGTLIVPNGDAKGTSTPLIAAHEIVTLPSASILALLRRDDRPRVPASKTIAVLADPVFTVDDPRVARNIAGRRLPTAQATVAMRSATADDPSAPPPGPDALEPLAAVGLRSGLSRLPFTRSEAQSVAALAPSASVLRATDFDASLALATSGRLSDYRIVHFATHGLINSARPELSGLALSLVDAQGRTQDGFLRLNTIYNLRLSADLVVLSACQSALGQEISGEGLIGLTRGFMHAGARRVIASLWQVDDVATAELMTRFYTGLLQKKLTPAAALRAAQLELRRQPQWSSPFFWAGFVLQGDWQ
jgi:CHAT domain-containing protein/Tfp pilus assembly protein PilF